MWLTVGRFLLGGLNTLWDLVRKLFDLFIWVVKWCLEHPSEAAAIAGFISSVWFWNKKEDAEQLAADNKQEFLEEKAAHKGTVANYRAAAVIRAKADRENVERVRAEAEAAAAKEREKYEIRIASYDARADRLLGRLEAAANSGSTPGEELPGDPNATCRAFGAADCEGLVTRMTDAQRSIDKLIGWQAFYTQIQEIDVNDNPATERNE